MLQVRKGIYLLDTLKLLFFMDAHVGTNFEYGGVPLKPIANPPSFERKVHP